MDRRGHLKTELAGERITLWPERALGWDGSLYVADLHWGKEASFRLHGVPLPGGMLAEGLARLSALVERAGCARLVVLGDLVHDRAGLTAEVVGAVAAWRARHAHVSVELVRGNHDRWAPALPEEWGVTELGATHTDGPFRLVHEAEPDPNGDLYTLGGHLHPVVALGARAERLTLPCFLLGLAHGVLPAFNTFTRGVRVTRAEGRIFVVADDEVVAL